MKTLKLVFCDPYLEKDVHFSVEFNSQKRSPLAGHGHGPSTGLSGPASRRRRRRRGTSVRTRRFFKKVCRCHTFSKETPRRPRCVHPGKKVSHFYLVKFFSNYFYDENTMKKLSVLLSIFEKRVCISVEFNSQKRPPPPSPRCGTGTP